MSWGEATDEGAVVRGSDMPIPPPPPGPPGRLPPRGSPGGVSRRGGGDDGRGVGGEGVFTFRSVYLLGFLDARERVKGRVKIIDSLSELFLLTSGCLAGCE